jgi:hypothetical protein
MLCVGVLAPCVQLGIQSSIERRWQLGFHVVAYRHVLIAPLALPLIFIEHINGLYHRRPIRTLIHLGSNPCEP